MKREWDIEELVEQFSLVGREIALLDGKASHTQLGLAVQLKFFQAEGRFPTNKREIPRTVLAFIAQQIRVDEGEFGKYAWDGRTIKRDRNVIRLYLGYQEGTQADKQILTDWLSVHPDLQYEHGEDYWFSMAYNRLRELHLEAFSPDEMGRAVRSALRTYQDHVCQDVAERIPRPTRQALDGLLEPDLETSPESDNSWSYLAKLKEEPAAVDLKSVLEETAKLRQLRAIGVSADLFRGVDPKWVEVYRQRVMAEHPYDLKNHPDTIRHTLLAAFCQRRESEVADDLVELLMKLTHKINTRAQDKIKKKTAQHMQHIYGKSEMLFKIAKASLDDPKGAVEEVVFVVVSQDKLQQVVTERDQSVLTYTQAVGQVMRRSYGRHYRRMLSAILETLQFRSNNTEYQPVIEALKMVSKYLTSKAEFYPLSEEVPLEGVVRENWREVVIVEQGPTNRIKRLDYELCVLSSLRDKLRATEIWVEGAKKFGNPDHLLKEDFQDQRTSYYAALNMPLDPKEFTGRLKAKLHEALMQFNTSVPTNSAVKLLTRGNGWIRLSPSPAQDEGVFLAKIKAEIRRVWSSIPLLDILKEADLHIHFTDEFKTIATRQELDPLVLRKRLLLALFGLGTNIGLKQASSGDTEQNADDLEYIKRYFINKENFRNANTKVVNATFEARQPHIWGQGSVACASDSSKFAIRGENLRSEWHNRYHGRGIMVYWHVERKALAIYSQLKAPSSSEVASMIEGVMHHATAMPVERNYVDTHGQSEIAFAFCHLLGFELLPRLKNLGKAKLHYAETGAVQRYPNLQPVLASKAIDFELIEQQYDLFIQYATALRLHTADAETILKRFTQTEVQHPTYQALMELGKVIKTLFLCAYLSSEALRYEIEEGLNVIETWNSANDFIGYGNSGELSGRRLLDHELSMLALQLLQNSLIYINTLLLQQVLAKPYFLTRMTSADWRGLTPLFWLHIMPYGTFKLDMDTRLPIEVAA